MMMFPLSGNYEFDETFKDAMSITVADMLSKIFTYLNSRADVIASRIDPPAIRIVGSKHIWLNMLKNIKTSYSKDKFPFLLFFLHEGQNRELP